MMDSDLGTRFAGALLGVFCGDALGMPFEGWSARRIAETTNALDGMRPAARWLRAYAAVHGLVHDPLQGVPRFPLAAGTYTDDTQMTIASAESLVERCGFDGPHMAERFVAAYDPRRGYGPGTAKVLRALRRGVAWDQAGKVAFHGRGSFGNGAAMRAAPMGLLYWRDRPTLIRMAEQAARITHAHPLGRDGGVVMAAAVAEAVAVPDLGALDPAALLGRLRQAAHTDIFRARLDRVGELLRARPTADIVIERLGTGTAAAESVPTAVYCALRERGSAAEAIMYAASLGGDTDTIAAMAGGIAGALHGERALPQPWLDALENGPKGRDYVRDLAHRLCALSGGTNP